jgi:hypothetical protein
MGGGLEMTCWPGFAISKDYDASLFYFEKGEGGIIDQI